MKEFFLIGVHFFFQELTSFEKKYKNKNGRIASPENVSTSPQMEMTDFTSAIISVRNLQPEQFTVKMLGNIIA